MERALFEEKERALVDGDLVLEFQPRVRWPGGATIGVEALVRWRLPDGTLRPPDQFITVAEEVGLSAALDEWVMREACRQNKEWQDEGWPSVPVSVNVSLARLDALRLVDQVQRTLADTGLPASDLEIEFTESQMFQHHDEARALISHLKALGVRIALDDFGVGYSNLSYLVQYKFDTLKIDRSFVSALPDNSKSRAVVQAIIGLGRALDYTVVAEGVETHSQARALEHHGCRDMHGYLYSRPLASTDVAALFQRRTVGVH